MEQEFSTRYDAALVEKKWYAAWEAAGLFEPDPDPAKPVYSITIPPPNITGSLHMGHALCYPIQDALARYKRLRGYSALVLPGQDHAGIATQSVVAKQLKKEGVSPVELGRERFVERVWEWRKESGDTILNQLRALGCGFDWSRGRFTLDPAYVEAVLKVFIEWFDRGWIYLGERVVNWDPVLETSVSDIETERKTIRGKLYHIRYPFADKSGYVVVATTRPETMLGDVAVAVHPSDSRYQGLVGKTLVLPLVGREIPLVADLYPDPAFGTGAVKITPAHDPNDFEVGVRHGLAPIVVLDTRAKVNEAGGAYQGLDRYEARKRIVADLEASGALEKIEDHDIPIIVSERSGEPIEPLLREEWFVKQSELAERAVKVVREGKIRFIPERYDRIYLEWMENLRDWNVSRNLWWGHRIPIYYADDGSMVAAHSADEAATKLGKPIVRQDDRVLDTWFSSGLWPFATLGWPNETDDLARYYPTSVLVTSREILFLWVARMVMMGLDFVGEIPFQDVYIYATVLTEDGKRMSKSLGTGVDPMDIIESKGADALRYTLFSQTGHNQDIRYSERRTDEARNFCNKIWNATRFILMHCGEESDAPAQLELVDEWILSRLYAAEQATRQAFDDYNLQEACSALYRFFWSELCDWYIEASKSRLEAGEAAPAWTLLQCLSAFLKLLHPLMPHITEDLYQRLPLKSKSPFVMSSEWPTIPEAFLRPESEQTIGRAFEAVRAIRALRAELGIAPMKLAPEVYVDGSLEGVLPLIQSQSWVEKVVSGKPAPEVKALFASTDGFDIHLPLGALMDDERLQQERERLAKREATLVAELEKLNLRINNPQFAERAKPEVVAEAQAQQAELSAEIEKLRDRQKLFGA